MQLNNVRFKDIYLPLEASRNRLETTQKRLHQDPLDIQLMKQCKQASYIYSINNAQGHPVTGFADIANVTSIKTCCVYRRTPLSTSLIKTHSVKILMEAFQSFSTSTRLIVNYNKSEIVTRGCKLHTELQIMQITSFVQGSLPFRYLGVPITAKIFVIPQEVIKQVTKICRNYLWNADSSDKKPLFVAWEEGSLEGRKWYWKADPNGKYTVSLGYKWFMGLQERKPPWVNLVSAKSAIPRHSVTAWLLMKKKLPLGLACNIQQTTCKNGLILSCAKTYQRSANSS
ncbi:LOW QUALITY PROTEIN: hypothetical protein Cgig2_008884 [Carnegiea gigantea]|uniref:Reverse transcriptase zinc-binding domain-containing protein n=1 Tax=Carnegiea gigantea TaxID=171969 RepID=A0A9Q1GYM4_9CARY|nr:LOW QUALITY PROTEIN: hypothetical protein Cgig2_008884 [Carnegiea gigantea]